MATGKRVAISPRKIVEQLGHDREALLLIVELVERLARDRPELSTERSVSLNKVVDDTPACSV